MGASHFNLYILAVVLRRISKVSRFYPNFATGWCMIFGLPIFKLHEAKPR